MKTMSVVTTLFKSEAYIEEFYSRIINELQKLQITEYEIIFVDDGSPDNSLDTALDLYKKDARIVVIKLSKNFGHHPAIMAGLEQSEGELVFLIDSDLEEAPENMSAFCQILEINDVNVVYGKQLKRRGGFFSFITGAIYYRTFRRLTGIMQPNDITTCRLMTRDYVNALILHQEKELSIGGIWLETGFKQIAAEITKEDNSETTYSFGKRLKTAVDAIASFSNAPLYLNFVLGIVILLFSFFLGCYFFITHMFLDTPVSGFASIAILTVFSFGIISFSNGINSLYLAKIFSEAKQRPRFIIQKKHPKRIGFNNDQAH